MVVLAAADMGDKASILLFFALAYEAALFQLGVQVHRATVGASAQPGAFRQRRQCFENLHERLRRLQSARIHFNDGNARASAGL
jgi:hypothetical protein